MEFYLQPNPTDPEWLARTAIFHGHLGPWLVLGALVGQDATRRLETPGQWKIQVTCWMPPDKQRTPFSCMLDGLQVSSGATLGKQNIRFDYSPDVLGESWPVVHVVRPKDAQRGEAGLSYRARHRLHELVRRVTPDTLESASRDLARMPVDGLFEIRELTAQEMAPRA